MGQTQVLPRTTTTPALPLPPTPLSASVPPQEESDPPTTSLTRGTPKHPKGHRVQNLNDVWASMDKQKFLKCTDSYALEDLWVQPISVEPTTTPYATVRMYQIILAPHLKSRVVCTTLAIDDLLKMLYLNYKLQLHMQGYGSKDFNQWLAEKTGEFIKEHGIAEQNNRALLCNFILNEDEDYTFYPTFLKYTMVVFRKISYHSYKTEGSEGERKVDNPSLMKCVAVRGKFEYLWEAKFVPMPVDYTLATQSAIADVTDTQVLDLP